MSVTVRTVVSRLPAPGETWDLRGEQIIIESVRHGLVNQIYDLFTFLAYGNRVKA